MADEPRVSEWIKATAQVPSCPHCNRDAGVQLDGRFWHCTFCARRWPLGERVLGVTPRDTP